MEQRESLSGGRLRLQVSSRDEHLPNLSRKAIGKAGWIWRGFVFWGNFPTRLIDIDRLHSKTLKNVQNVPLKAVHFVDVLT